MRMQIVKFIPFFLVTSMVFFFECPDAFGQYNSRYNQGYGNSYSGNRGYNQGYNQGYNSGGLNRGGLGSSRMGSSRMGSSRMGSSRMGSSRMGSSRYGRYNQSGGYNQSGYNQSGYNSRGRSSRSSRYNRNSSAGSSYVPQSAQQPAIGGMQTTPGASSSDRRRALSGKTGLGALPPSSKSGKSDSRAGGIQILGKAQAGKQAASGKKRAPSKKGAKKKAPTQSVATYYLSSLNTVALLNQPMTVDIVLSNPKKLGFNKFGFMLEYNPDILVPITGFDEENNKPILAYQLVTSASAEQAEEAESNQTSAEKNNLAPSFLLAETKHTYQISQNEIQPGKGIIHFEAQVKNESSTDQGIVAQVTFLPVKVTKNSSITFSFQDEDNDNQPPTFLLENGNDQLGSGFNPIDGTVNYDFTVVSSYDEFRERTIIKSKNQRFSDTEGEDHSTSITLLPRQKNVEVGDFVDVDVYLSNPDQVAIDSVNLLIAFNPRVFEPVDADEYKPGININDQDYTEQFPFDFPLLNSIDVERGIVDFRKRVNRSPVREEGVLATIRLKAVRPTTKTTFRIFLNENGEAPTTGIFYRNMDRLGDPSDPFDGASTASVAVQPTMAYLKQIQDRLEKG